MHNENSTTLSFNKIPGKYILSISHFYRYKNYETLIKAYFQLPLNITEEYSLIIVGKFHDIKYASEIKKLISSLNLSTKIKIIQGLDKQELNMTSRNARLFIFPSLVENCPNILLEAMSFKLHIISSNIYPMPEFGGESINYFSPKNSGELAYKIEKLLSSENIKSANEEAFNQSQKFSWDEFTNRVIKIFK